MKRIGLILLGIVGALIIGECALRIGAWINPSLGGTIARLTRQSGGEHPFWSLALLAACTGDSRLESPHEEGGDGEESARSVAIDVADHLSIAAHSGTRPLGDLDPWGVVPVGIAVGRDGAVYWAQYRTDSIVRAGADATEVRTIATVDGPLGIALDGDRIFYTTDRHYPRTIGSVRPGQEPQTLLAGMMLNRPFAIAFASGEGALYWTESVNGRIRRTGPAFENVETIFDDGIANVEEAPEVVALSSFGIAVDPSRGLVFWSDLRTATIQRSRLDGSDRETVLTAAEGLVAPTALAIDPDNATLFWADPGAERIGRADIDGNNPEVLADTDSGVLEPYGLTVDPDRHLLYWTDIARSAIRRVDLRTGQVSSYLDLPARDERAWAEARDDSCTTSSLEARRDFLQRRVKAIRTCVAVVTATKAVMRSPDELQSCAAVCRHELAAMPGVDRLRERLPSNCPQAQADAMIEELLSGVAQTVAADLPRAATYLVSVRPFIAAWPEVADSQTTTALAALDDLVGRMRALAPRSVDRFDTPVPATGQSTSYSATTRNDATVLDDAAAAAAGASRRMSHVDNRDGTISDAVTGLMWEKKCDACEGLHAVNARYVWKTAGDVPDVAEWLASIRSEGGTGFAGYSDWRLPSIEELLTIIDFENFNPTVGPSFDGAGCGLGCRSLEDPDCSCTNLGAYWSSGESPRPDDVVPVAGFQFGAVWGQRSDSDAYLRAVRGPERVRRDRFVDNGDGTISDHVTGLMWEKKCLRPGDLHDVDRSMYWTFDGREETLWDWIAAINEEGERGFAGYNDWRIPNVKEMISIFDGLQMDPAIDRVFAAHGCDDVSDPRCSLTSDEPHWTSTTFSDFPALALSVNFNPPGESDDEVPDWVIRVVGGVEPHEKTLAMVTRAVRGPVPRNP